MVDGYSEIFKLSTIFWNELAKCANLFVVNICL